MATEMKQLLALLLLVCVCTVHGQRGPRNRDHCTNGLAAIELFARYKDCPDPRPSDVLRDLWRSIGDITVSSLELVATNYCSSVMPRLVQCFEGNVQNCTEEQQLSLKTVAQQTGFLCQPNSSSVHPVMIHLLSRLTDADVARMDDCRIDEGDIVHRCGDRALEAIGVINHNFTILEHLSMKDLAPKIQTYVGTMFECTITQVRDLPNRCGQWRGTALRAVRFMFRPILGQRMVFTNQEIDRMFEWDEPCGTDC